MPAPRGAPVSVIVPAHNESAGIGRLLRALVVGDGQVEVLVVCNGCTDDTAAVAARVPGVRVIEITEASKQAALAEGNRLAAHPTRVYCDADISITRADLLRLVAGLDGSVLAAAPRRRLDLTGARTLVRRYYQAWQRLPSVRGDLFGRGVIALAPEGVRRVRDLPRVIADDLAISEAFRPDERAVIEDAESVVAVPRTLRDLVRRRTRVAEGNRELDQLGMRRPEARTGWSDLARIARGGPQATVDVAVFVGVTAAARGYQRLRRLRGTSGWLRDESSRGG